MRQILRFCMAALFLYSCQTKPGNLIEKKPLNHTGHELKKVASVEGITSYELANGLEVLFFPDPSQEKVTVNMSYFVGSRHEGYGEAGMAHLLEHMLFKGTPKRPNIWESLSQRGAEFNATTTVDRTNYFASLAPSKENLAFILALEADRMVNSNLDKEDLKKEFSVVRNEFEMGENSPFKILLERLHGSAFIWHNYGKSTIGNKSDIEKVPVENLRNFYHRYYQPDNAMLVVAGKFDLEKAKTMVEKHFASIPRPKRKLPKTHTVEPVQDGERFVTLRRSGEVGLAGVLYHISQASHDDFPALGALAHILLDNSSGILFNNIVKKGLATSIVGNTFAWKEPGTFWAIAQVADQKDPQKVVNRMTQIIENLDVASISPMEIERYKKQVLSGFRMSLADSQAIAISLSEWAAMGDWRLMFIYRDRIENLKAAEVREVYKKYFLPSNRTAGVFIPTPEPKRAPSPESVDVKSLVAGYKGKAPIVPGEIFDPTFENISKRLKISTLSNGTKLAALPKKTRGELVTIHAVFRYGSEKSLIDKQVAEFMLPALMVRGTKSLNLEQFKDRLVELDMSIAPSHEGRGELAFTINTTRTHLSEALELFGDMLNAPRFDPDEFKVVKEQILASLRQNLVEPQAIASIELKKTGNPFPSDSIHYVHSTQETIQMVRKIKIGDIKRLFRDQWDPSRSTVAVLGDFDVSQLKVLLSEAIAKRKVKVPFKDIVKPFQSSIVTSKVVDTPDKKAAMVSVGHNLKLNINDSRYLSAKIATFVFGQSPSSRLTNRLRQKEGLAYSTSGGLIIPIKGDFSQFIAYSICAPENAQKVADILIEETQLLAQKGLTQEELEKAKQAFAEKEKSQFADDSQLVRILELGLRSQLSIDFFAQRAKNIEKLSLAKVNKDIRSMIRPQRLAKVVAADLSKLSKPTH